MSQPIHSTSAHHSRLRLVRNITRAEPLAMTYAAVASLGVAVGGTTPLGLPDQSVSGYEERYFMRGTFPGGRWLHHPLAVRVAIEASDYVAEQPQTAVVGFGASPMEAIMDLRNSLAEHYEELEAAGEKLSPRLMRQRDWLRQAFTSSNG